jgi:hypothetical protein
VHIHADLIVGLPGEDLASFGRGFDRLVALEPQEIQVGILKRLRGTPIVRHDVEYAMVYASQPPYEILQNRDLKFATMQRMRRFARYWDLMANSGRFAASLPLLWRDASPFERFLAFADWLFSRLRRTNEISLNALAESLQVFLTEELGMDEAEVRAAMEKDFAKSEVKDRPAFLRTGNAITAKSSKEGAGPKRQKRHVMAVNDR